MNFILFLIRFKW